MSSDLTAPDLVLAGADNFRDVAGPGYAVPGGLMRRGVLYRSNRLDIGADDAERLERIGTRLMLDLREEWETLTHQDAPVVGCEWRLRTVPGIPMERLRSLRSQDETDREMRKHYRGFVSEPGRRAGLAAAIQAVVAGLRDGQVPQVFHCSAGKDRTGWLAALVQHAVGVAWDDVVADYLLTDDRTASSRAASMASLERDLGIEQAAVLAPAWICQVDHLEEARDEAVRCHGGLDGYLRDGLGVTDADVTALRDNLVEGVR
jgi:protein-tyrosine phosphatase